MATAAAAGKAVRQRRRRPALMGRLSHVSMFFAAETGGVIFREGRKHNKYLVRVDIDKETLKIISSSTYHGYLFKQVWFKNVRRRCKRAAKVR